MQKWTKLLIVTGVALSIGTTAKAQIKVGNNINTINPAALIEMESTSKGLLISRMTAAQMNAIASPPIGLMVYNTDANCFFYYSGTAWTSLCVTFSGAAAGGDLSGTFPNPTVVGIQGRSVSGTAPTSGQALVWNGTQ